jgi:hypothetical protein
VRVRAFVHYVCMKLGLKPWAVEIPCNRPIESTTPSFAFDVSRNDAAWFFAGVAGYSRIMKDTLARSGSAERMA